MNEPRNPSDTSGDALQAWLETTTLAIKALDGNHMVTIGAEVRLLQVG
jgi:endo-1,4-beta-mannosidase